MSIAAGSQRQFAHVNEVAAGVDPGTPYTIDRFLAGARLWNEQDELKSAEFRPDRSVAPGANGAKHCKFTGPFELSFGSHEDHIASAFCAAWVAAGTAAAGQTVTVVAGTTNTMGATAIGSGLAVGDWVKISGFTGSYVANNGYFRITAVAAALITLGEAVDASGASRLVACSSQASISVQKMGYITPGAVEKSMAIESAALDISVFGRGLGIQMNKMSLAIARNAIITGQFDGVGLQLPAPAAVKYRTGTDVAASTTVPFQSNNSKSLLWLDGSVLAIATALNLSLVNGMDDFVGAFQSIASDILLGRSDLSGSMTIGFVDSTTLAKAYNGTRVALRAQLMDALGASGYAIDIPTVKLAMPSEDTQENQRFHTYNWQAEKDASGIINCKLWKLA